MTPTTPAGPYSPAAKHDRTTDPGDRNLGDRAGAGAEAVSQPVFLVGSMRSGTSMLRLMLDNHPELAFFHEFPFSVEMLAEEGWPDMQEYYRYLASNRIFQDSGLSVDTGLDYPGLMNSFLKQKRDRDGKRLVGATVHLQFDRLLRIWPDARFIYLLRDGRDVARSCIGMGWAGNMYRAVDSWVGAERLWKSFVPSLPPERWTELRYEDLVRDPVSALTRVCRFIGLAYDPAMLGYGHSSTYEAPDPKLAEQWRTKLSPWELRLAEARIGDMLAERGYELSGQPRLTVGPVRDWWLRQHDRWNRIAFRRRRLGVRLLAAEMFMRVAAPSLRYLERQRRRTVLRLHEVERAYLK